MFATIFASNRNIPDVCVCVYLCMFFLFSRSPEREVRCQIWLMTCGLWPYRNRSAHFSAHYWFQPRAHQSMRQFVTNWLQRRQKKKCYMVSLVHWHNLYTNWIRLSISIIKPSTWPLTPDHVPPPQKGVKPMSTINLVITLLFSCGIFSKPKKKFNTPVKFNYIKIIPNKP